MSEPLTETAPDSEFAAFEDAPGAFEAAVEDSGSGGGKTVPAERFNGLMSKFNKTNEQLAYERQQRMDLESRLERLELNEYDFMPKEPDMPDVTNLQQQVEILTQMLAQQQVDSVRREVLTEYPDIAPFVDLIEAPNAESFKELAKTLNERVQVLKVVGDGQGESPETVIVSEAEAAVADAGAPEAEVPVFGGGSGAMSPAPSSEDRIADAIRNKDFGAFMRAKTEQVSSELSL